MHSVRTTAIAAAILLAGGLLIVTRQGSAQPTNVAGNKPQRIKEFKKPDPAQLKKKLSDEQFAVTQQCGTEPPFHNAYWDNHKPGTPVMFCGTDSGDNCLKQSLKNRHQSAKKS